MPGLDLLKRLRLMAGLTGMRAPGRKTAAGLGIDGRNQFTLDQNALGRIMNIHSSCVSQVSTSCPRYITQI